ncbi:MAG: response regulator [Proteobacteria bacterium]|nr:response regulator [Desulfobacula sp.]MBU4131378.1 response regulator [Pseudomonadota bacterium]
MAQTKSPDDMMLETGTKTILIVEDEEMVRDIAVKALASFGYKTLIAEDGEKAVQLFANAYKSIDAVLLDIIMPKMSGTETFRQMLEIDPQVRVLIATGHITNQDQKKIFTKAKAYLEKPYQIMELKKAIESILK